MCYEYIYFHIYVGLWISSLASISSLAQVECQNPLPKVPYPDRWLPTTCAAARAHVDLSGFVAWCNDNSSI